jgi:hypothetical protein
MGAQMTKRELWETLRAEWERWEKLVAQVKAGRMDRASVAGGWSVQDMVAHLTAWERQPVAWLEAVRTGNSPQPPAWPTTLSEPEINAWLCALNRGRTWRDVRAESREVHRRLVQLFRHASEDDLMARGRFEWLNGKSLMNSIASDTFEHYQDHACALQAWLQRSK